MKLQRKIRKGRTNIRINGVKTEIILPKGLAVQSVPRNISTSDREIKGLVLTL